MASTTIKIDARVRDALNAEAQRRGTTAGSVVEDLLERWLREQRFAAMREAIATSADDDVSSYSAETRDFERLEEW